jgi:hypothetical protein
MVDLTAFVSTSITETLLPFVFATQAKPPPRSR